MIAWAEMEHRAGVLPLLAAFFAAQEPFAEMFAGRRLGALGLFTPAPEPGWGAAALAGEPAAEPANGGVLLRGDVRLPGPAASGSIVLVRLPDAEHRLAWIGHDSPGVERRGSRAGGPAVTVAASADCGPCWLHLEEVWVGPELLSRPVTLASDGELARHLVSYADVWAAAAALCAREGVRALRLAARTAAFHTSQLVALGITEVEIEADLTAAAVQRNRNGLAVAAAAARTLSAVAAKTEELRDVYGIEVDGPFAGAAAKTLTAFLGGPLLLENELARALGIQEAHA